MKLVLDMSGQMDVMEEYMAQSELADCEQAQKDEAVRMSSPRPATCIKEPTPRKEDACISKAVRSKLAHQLKQSPF